VQSGARLYFNFHAAAVNTEAAFTKQLDLLERELGDRGRRVAAAGASTAAAAAAATNTAAAATAAARMPEGVPPKAVASAMPATLEPTPEPAPVAPTPAANDAESYCRATGSS